jgi:hypothetical protein
MDAEFPHVLRMNVNTDAICSSLRRQLNAGIAGAVGRAAVETARDPSSVIWISVVASSDRTAVVVSARKGWGVPVPASVWQAAQLSL